MNRVFIGWDDREATAAEVCRHSIESRSSIPVDIAFLKLADMQARGYAPVERGGATQFSYTRFLIPWLCNYEGIALFMDCDMVVLGDIAEIFALPAESFSLMCTKLNFRSHRQIKMDGQKQVDYNRKLWSSFMLLNCAKLRLWSKENVERYHGAALHQFVGIPDDEIGSIPVEWNEVGPRTLDTKCYHYTEYNPWMNPGQHPYEDLWHRELANLPVGLIN